MSAKQRVTAILSPEQLGPLIIDPDPLVRALASRAQCLTPAQANVLASDPSTGVRSSLAARHHGVLPPSPIVSDHEAMVRGRLASNSRDDLPEQIFRTLSQDLVELVRLRLARNQRAVQFIGRTLALDSSKNVRVALAQNHSVRTDVVEVLLTDFDERVRYHAALHPNAPNDLLVILRRYTKSYFLTSKLYSGYLEEPTNNVVRERLLSVGQLAHQIAVQIKSTRKDDLERVLFSTNSDEVIAAIMRHENCDVRWLDTYANHHASIVRSRVSENNKCPTAILEKLSYDIVPRVRDSVARNSMTPPSVVERLFHDPEVSVSHSAFRNAVVTRAMVEGHMDRSYCECLHKIVVHASRILNDDDWKMLIALTVGEPKSLRVEDVVMRCPRSLLPLLEQHPNWSTAKKWTRYRADDSYGYYHQHMQELSLDVLQAKSADYLREQIWLPEDYLNELATHVDPAVRRVVVSHPNVTKSILWTLAHDSDDGVVANVASERLSAGAIVEFLMCHPSQYVRAAVAGNSLTSEKTLAQLSCDLSENVRERVATHRATHSEILTRLQHDPSIAVRGAVARNPHTPSVVLQALTHDENLNVRIDATMTLALTYNLAP